MTKADLEIINAKELLTVKEVSVLLRCSKKTIYRNIKNGNIKATNLGKRITRIKRADINDLFK